jgi:hypothetical protein
MNAKDLRSGADLSSSGRNTDDRRNTPALVTGFQSLPHDLDVSCSVKGKVTTAVRHLDQLVDDALSLRKLLGVDEVG